MDNYKKLFKENRPEINNTIKLPNPDEINLILNSEWLRNKILAVNAYQQRNYKDALLFIDKAIQDESNNSRLYKIRANIKEDCGDSASAISDYKKALFFGGDWYATYNQIAINFLNLKKFPDALTAFDIAINLKIELSQEGLSEDIYPYIIDGVVERVDFEKIYTNRANVKLNLEDYQGCADDCNEAIIANPDYSNSYFIFGLLFLTINEDNNAYKLLKVAEEKGHNQATGIINEYFK